MTTQPADFGPLGDRGQQVVGAVRGTVDRHRRGARGRAHRHVATAQVVVESLSWHSGVVPNAVVPGRGMSFDVGDKVVYPHHGAAVIERRERRDAFGTDREYLVLKLAYGDLTLMVPADNTDEVGLREVINDEEVEEVFAVLRKKEARMPTNWSRRFKNHVEKLKSGDIYQVAEVVRNLSIREKDKGLSAGEKRMLTKARQILVSELTFAIGVTEEEAELKLDEALP
jgi:CarD family transcriptional regulator